MVVDPFNTGNTAWLLTSAALVMIMTPGLGFFYGGLVGKKHALTILMESLFSLGWTTVIWVLVGFTLSFGPDFHGVIGGLKYAFFAHLGELTDFLPYAVPMNAFAMFQLMFAVITPALITGAFANKMRFKPYIAFLTLWLFLVYFPVAHWVWGGGFLQKLGVEDFAGGIVVHASAGFSALAAALYLKKSAERNSPHNLMFMALGTALLWFGWFGFNAGSAVRAGGDAAVAFVNTQVAAAFAAVTWVFIDALRGGKITTAGFCTGAIAGLATVTPTAGYIPEQFSPLVGIVAAAIAYGAVQLKNRMGWDDVLDVWGVHGMGGYTGIVLLGIFASSAVLGSNGLLLGNPGFFGLEVGAVTLVSVYAFVATYVILWIISRFTRVEATPDEVKKGLDFVEFGESAYA